MDRVSPTEAEDKCAAITRELTKVAPFGPAVLKILSISLDDDSAGRLFVEAFKSDPALTAELLVMANSAAFGGRSQVQTIQAAVAHLGLERVRSLAASSALRVKTKGAECDAYLATVWAHAIATAVAAEALGDSSACPGLYTLGLTHDLGRLGMFLGGGQPYAIELSKEFSTVEEANVVEKSTFGMTHSQAGALAAKAWRFPDSLAACMGAHHSPPPGPQVDARGLIVTACQMADSLGFPEVPLSDTPPWPQLNPRLAQLARLEPESLWDEITGRITDLGG